METFDSHDRLVLGATSGASAVAVIQLASVSQLDTPQVVAAFAFAIALPFLVADLVLSELEVLGKTEVQGWYQSSYASFLSHTGMRACVVGFCALFWHLHLGAGVVFACTTILVVFAWKRHGVHARRLSPKKPSEEIKKDA